MPAGAFAATGTGGAAAPDRTTEQPQQPASGNNGGATFGDRGLTPEPGRTPKPRPAPRTSGRPLLTQFQVGPSSLFAYGPPARVKFAISGRSPTVRVKLIVIARGSRKVLRSLDLGDRATGWQQTYSFNGGDLPQGSFQLELAARDPGGRRLRSTAKASNVNELSFHWHRFPLVGKFDYGQGADGRFGAPRN